MNASAPPWPRLLVFLVAGSLLQVVLACNRSSAGGAQLTSASASPARVRDPGISLQCVADQINKAPAPFHWSYKKSVPPFTDADWEANVAPDSIDGTLVDTTGSHAIHGVRTNTSGWNTAVLVLTGSLPASTFTLVQNSSATKRAGAENLNGLQTLKYSIDTTNDTAADASLIRSVLGANGFIKGTAWVTQTGCPVRFTLDVEQDNKDGTVQKEHYEANMTTN